MQNSWTQRFCGLLIRSLICEGIYSRSFCADRCEIVKQSPDKVCSFFMASVRVMGVVPFIDMDTKQLNATLMRTIKWSCDLPESWALCCSSKMMWNSWTERSWELFISKSMSDSHWQCAFRSEWRKAAECNTRRDHSNTIWSVGWVASCLPFRTMRNSWTQTW